MTKLGVFDRDGSDRGQFITLGIVFLIFVIISGVLVAYVGVMSYEDRRDGVSQQQDVTATVDSISDSLASTMAGINRDPEVSDPESEFENAFEAEIDTYNDVSRTEDVSGNIRETITGSRIVQTDPSANFSAENNGNYEADWTAFTGATDARQFTVRVDGLTLPTTVETAPTFVIGTDDGTRNVSLYFDDDEGSVVIDEEGEGQVCSVSANIDSPVTIDLLNGEVDSEPCHNYRIDSPVNSVEIENGGEVEGTFSMVYRDGAEGNAVETDTTPPEYGAEDSPVQTDVVYAVVADMRTVGSGTGVTQPILIAPGSNQAAIEN